MSKQQKRYPFKFLDAYKRTDADIFFGRDEEIEALYQMVSRSDMVMVYGASGTGKTSLIQCGLSSRFELHEWQAINVRKGPDINLSLRKALEEQRGDTEEGELAWLDELDEEASNSGSETEVQRLLKQVYLKNFRPVFLIFDQFEELYVLGGEDEQQVFFQQVADILQVDQPVKLIFSIREEYVGHLYEFEKKVPSLLKRKLRVEKMNYGKVAEVLSRATDGKISLINLRAGEEDAIISKIFETVKGEDKGLSLQLPYLQVFMDKLYIKISGDKNRKTPIEISSGDLEKLGKIEDVLRDFLDEQVKEISEKQPAADEEKIWKCLSPFATLEGTKEPISVEQLGSKVADVSPSFLEEVISELVNRRILRVNEAEGVYEMAHDSLAKQVALRRSSEDIAALEVYRLIASQTALVEEKREFFTEKQLGIIEPFEEKLGLEAHERDWIEKSKLYREEERKQAVVKQQQELDRARSTLRRIRAYLALALMALVVAGYFAYRANQETERATRSQERAERNLESFYQAEIQRLQNQINTAERNINSYELYGAEEDIMFLEQERIQGFKESIAALQDSIKSIRE